MPSFLITVNPDNRERGFPLQDLQSLVRRLHDGDVVEGDWRFRNNHASPGDRVFLLIQGMRGPAIIGYGRVSGQRKLNDSGSPVASIKFENLVDPSTTECLASKEALFTIDDGGFLWRTPFSGRLLEKGVAAKLEALVVEHRGKIFPDALDDTGSDAPDRVNAVTIRYLRDPEIRKRVKYRAKGKCEFCGQEGFIGTDGAPYLECHHIIALAKDGTDRMTNVIALCPGDHREAHFGKRAEELEREMSRKLRIIEGVELAD